MTSSYTSFTTFSSEEKWLCLPPSKTDHIVSISNILTARVRSTDEGNVFISCVCPQGAPPPPRSRSGGPTVKVQVWGPPGQGLVGASQVMVQGPPGQGPGQGLEGPPGQGPGPRVKVQVKVWGTPMSRSRGPHRSRSRGPHRSRYGGPPKVKVRGPPRSRSGGPLTLVWGAPQVKVQVQVWEPPRSRLDKKWTKFWTRKWTKFWNKNLTKFWKLNILVKPLQ